MKISFSVAISAVALCAATATAFTVGQQNTALSRSIPRVSNTSLKMSEALAAQETFAKGEIESNDVSQCFRFCHSCGR